MAIDFASERFKHIDSGYLNGFIVKSLDIAEAKYPFNEHGTISPLVYNICEALVEKSFFHEWVGFKVLLPNTNIIQHNCTNDSGMVLPPEKSSYQTIGLIKTHLEDQFPTIDEYTQFLKRREYLMANEIDRIVIKSIIKNSNNITKFPEKKCTNSATKSLLKNIIDTQIHFIENKIQSRYKHLNGYVYVIAPYDFYGFKCSGTSCRLSRNSSETNVRYYAIDNLLNAIIIGWKPNIPNENAMQYALCDIDLEKTNHNTYLVRMRNIEKYFTTSNYQHCVIQFAA